MEYIPKSDAKLYLNEEEKTTMLKASEIIQKMEDYFDEVSNDASVRVNEWEFIPSIDCFTFTEIGDICKDLGTFGEVSVW